MAGNDLSVLLVTLACNETVSLKFAEIVKQLGIEHRSHYRHWINSLAMKVPTYNVCSTKISLLAVCFRLTAALNL